MVCALLMPHRHCRLRHLLSCCLGCQLESARTETFRYGLSLFVLLGLLNEVLIVPMSSFVVLVTTTLPCVLNSFNPELVKVSSVLAVEQDALDPTHFFCTFLVLRDAVSCRLLASAWCSTSMPQLLQVLAAWLVQRNRLDSWSNSHLWFEFCFLK